MPTLLAAPFVKATFKPFVASASADDMATLRTMIGGGSVRTVVERSFSFEEIPDALRAFGVGHALEKYVIEY